MYDHVLSYVCTFPNQTSSQVTPNVGCQSGDCRWLVNLPLGLSGYVWVNILTLSPQRAYLNIIYCPLAAHMVLSLHSFLYLCLLICVTKFNCGGGSSVMLYVMNLGASKQPLSPRRAWAGREDDRENTSLTPPIDSSAAFRVWAEAALVPTCIEKGGIEMSFECVAYGHKVSVRTSSESVCYATPYSHSPDLPSPK